jgi:hypothetical protein
MRRWCSRPSAGRATAVVGADISDTCGSNTYYIEVQDRGAVGCGTFQHHTWSRSIISGFSQRSFGLLLSIMLGFRLVNSIQLENTNWISSELAAAANQQLTPLLSTKWSTSPPVRPALRTLSGIVQIKQWQKRTEALWPVCG